MKQRSLDFEHHLYHHLPLHQNCQYRYRGLLSHQTVVGPLTGKEK